MMEYPTSARTCRYLGDTKVKEVHNLYDEVQGEGGCNIDELFRSGHAVCFTPESLEDIEAAGYTRCPKCFES